MHTTTVDVRENRGLVWAALLIFAIEGMYGYRAPAVPVAGG